MDVQFLTSMCESYIIDNWSQKYTGKELKQKQEEITTEVISMMRELRETDLELYDMLYDRDRVTQQQIIKTYIDFTYGDDDVINESLILTSLGITTIVTLMFSGKISKLAMNTAAKVGASFEGLGKFITKHGRFWKLRYSIIQKTHESCYVKCGVKREELSSMSYMGIRRDVQYITPKAKRQGECLAECYIESAINALGLLLQSYFMCLKKTGSFTDFEAINADDLLKVIGGLKLGVACQEYFHEVKNGFDNFYDLLDLVYSDDEKLKQEKMMKLKEQLIKSRAAISRFNDKQQGFRK